MAMYGLVRESGPGSPSDLCTVWKPSHNPLDMTLPKYRFILCSSMEEGHKKLKARHPIDADIDNAEIILVAPNVVNRYTAAIQVYKRPMISHFSDYGVSLPQLVEIVQKYGVVNFTNSGFKYRLEHTSGYTDSDLTIRENHNTGQSLYTLTIDKEASKIRKRNARQRATRARKRDERARIVAKVREDAWRKMKPLDELYNRLSKVTVELWINEPELDYYRINDDYRYSHRYSLGNAGHLRIDWGRTALAEHDPVGDLYRIVRLHQRITLKKTAWRKPNVVKAVAAFAEHIDAFDDPTRDRASHLRKGRRTASGDNRRALRWFKRFVRLFAKRIAKKKEKEPAGAWAKFKFTAAEARKKHKRKKAKALKQAAKTTR